jgi:hypothetical protein
MRTSLPGVTEGLGENRGLSGLSFVPVSNAYRRRARGLLRGRGAGPIASGPCRIVLDSDDYPHVVSGHVRQYPDWYPVHRSDYPAGEWPQVKMPRRRQKGGA